MQHSCASSSSCRAVFGIHSQLRRGRGFPFCNPGGILSGWLEGLGMSQSAFATHIGISRVMQSRILHGHAARAADMDLRLAEAQGTSSGFWLRRQVQRDLRETAQRARRFPCCRPAPPPGLRHRVAGLARLPRRIIPPLSSCLTGMAEKSVHDADTFIH
ncbi:HigA family addiction module antitoxin [Microvirgula aerodenitrificans]|uniref:HigA family addiction module antitoxin n=1 Tax=Microvirgula aerodenitrificans TaxID=57480 RepID=UPI002F42CE0A